MDAVQRANSGHSRRYPIGMTDGAEVLWNHHLKHDPADPAWADRTRGGRERALTVWGM